MVNVSPFVFDGKSAPIKPSATPPKSKAPARPPTSAGLSASPTETGPSARVTSHTNGPSSPISTPQQSYRAALLLGRWGRRTREAHLQSHASALGRDVRLREAFVQLRSQRAAQLLQWHKEKSAELQRWRSLMRLVQTVWNEWHKIYSAAAVHRIFTEQAINEALLVWTMQGWLLYLRGRKRGRKALWHYAYSLERFCLRGWAAYMSARREKHSARQQLALRASRSKLTVAWKRLAENAERRGVALLERAAAERLALEASGERAFATWTAHRTRLARVATQERRAYLFMGRSLLGRVNLAWVALVRKRRELDALLPHAAMRLNRTRASNTLRTWNAVITAHSRALTLAAERRAAVWTAGAYGAIRALLSFFARRSQRQRALKTAGAAVALGRVGTPWRAWRAAYNARVADRSSQVVTARVLRSWNGRTRRRDEYSRRLAAAAELAALALAARTTAAWRGAARTSATHRAAIIGARRRQMRRAAERSMERWVSFSMLRMLEGAGIEQARQRAASHSVTAWRDLTAASIDFERRWRRAIRHRYRSLVRLVVGAWRGLLAKQHARWGVVLEAETRFGRRRRTRALWQWYNLAVPAATAATLAEAHAVLGRKRRSLPRWRDGAAHVLERSQARHLAVCHWAGVVCRR